MERAYKQAVIERWIPNGVILVLDNGEGFLLNRTVLALHAVICDLGIVFQRMPDAFCPKAVKMYSGLFEWKQIVKLINPLTGQVLCEKEGAAPCI